MRTALLLHAVHPGLGGVLVRGEKGTAKSTAVRALARLLPEIDVVTGCPFGCDPAAPALACDDCAAVLAGSDTPAVSHRAVPVVELPIGATEDRVLGSLDLEAAIQSGARRFEPGLLARANRGILYIDEVNLLADHLVDVLLDAAAMGRNYVERESVSFSHPASFILVGTMNPEEGELRPQLLDRFALMVEVTGLREPAARAEAVQRRIAFERDPLRFAELWSQSESDERHRVVQARAALPAVSVSDGMLDLIVHICAAFAVDGLRADLAIYRAATALAAYNGRDEVARDDVRLAAELALGHRRRRQPFDDPGLDEDQLNRLIEGSDGKGVNGASPVSRDDGRDPAATGDSQPRQTPLPTPPARTNGGTRASSHNHRTDPASPLMLALPPVRSTARRVADTGRRAAKARDRLGFPVAPAPPRGGRFELALAATLRAAAPFQVSRRAAGPGPAVRLRQTDLRERIRRGRSSALAVFAVDASGSMGAQNRMALAKSAVIGLLLDAYRRRDRVALIAFRGAGAEVLLPPTNSVALAENRLRALPTGGKTPLAAGLKLAGDLFQRSQLDGKPRLPILALVSDGRANAGGAGEHPWRAALREAERIRQAGVTSIFLDPDKGRAGAGLGRALAKALGAEHVSLDSLGITRETGVDA